MSSEKFCLRWNDFESNISSAFRELRDDKDFFDVTLACDDEQIQAHKVILSACSPFFRNILRRNIHQHPLLYLKGVKYTDLQAVLNFMYHGEVNVAQDELNSFLAVAEDLRVKGLTQNQAGSQNLKQSSANYESPKSTQEPKAISRPSNREPPPPKRPRPTAPVHQPQYEEDIQEVVPIKSEPRDTTEQINTSSSLQHQTTAMYTTPQTVALAEQEDSLTTYQEEGYEEYAQYDEQYEEQHLQGHDGGAGVAAGKGHPVDIQDLDQYVKSIPNTKDYQCSMCEFVSNRPAKVKNHLEAIHFPGVFVYSCDLCDKTFNGRNAFGVHKTTVHSKKKFIFWFQEQILSSKILVSTLASILTRRTIIVHCAKSFNRKNHPKWRIM